MPVSSSTSRWRVWKIGLAVIGTAARKVPGAGIRTSGLFHKEDAVGPLDEGIDAKVGLRCHFEISIPGDVF